MQAGAGHCLIDVHQILALAEGIQHHGHGTDVERVGPDIQEVIQNPGDLVEHHADVLGPQGNFEAQELLDGHAVGVLIAHHRDVIQPIHIGYRLNPGTRFG